MEQGERFGGSVAPPGSSTPVLPQAGEPTFYVGGVAPEQERVRQTLSVHWASAVALIGAIVFAVGIFSPLLELSVSVANGPTLHKGYGTSITGLIVFGASVMAMINGEGRRLFGLGIAGVVLVTVFGLLALDNQRDELDALMRSPMLDMAGTSLKATVDFAIGFWLKLIGMTYVGLAGWLVILEERPERR